MPEQVKLPRKLSQEPGGPSTLRPSHRRVIEEIDRWANSPGLRPPSDTKELDDKRSRGRQRERRPRWLADDPRN
ncbi:MULTISPECIES: hypothetical protein [Bradyrhizobium]|jgi:hypothetical protein|uniref:hypothetical protein n=1 Tax=Bradyrhizobium TaxID=374 RepID=UPI000464FCE5|nr:MULTISPECIES: hypothetical protein [Bradyrhizobium]KIU48640.1 hypothetical protein QU41_14125 [Bradyrhizobium elkanii]OCX29362.1 hypothetical protein QU42_20910 [Bradyrhizobium sp. UASWS1016]